MNEYQLVNFKMNPITKKQFHSICKENHLGMTSVLNKFCTDFIEKYDRRTQDQKDNEENSMIDFYFYNSVEDFQ
jgi:arsenate reductase-like glutaredoxin family protein